MSALTQLSRIALLLSALFSTGITMASSLPLLSASELAGAWTLQQGQDAPICHLQLLASEREQASGYALEGDLSCLKQWLSSAPQAWRPTPAGIALLEAEGLTLLHLSLQSPDVYQGQQGNSGQLLLRRQ